MPGPGITDIHVNRDTIAGELNIGRHFDAGPFAIVEIRARKIRDAPKMIARVMIFPPAIERSIERRLEAFAVCHKLDFCSSRRIGTNDHRGVRRQIIAAGELWIFPVVQRYAAAETLYSGSQ